MVDDLALDSLLIELQARGISLRRADKWLMVNDPSKAITPGLSAQIKHHKPALLDWLNKPAGLAVVVYPSDQARYDLLMRLLSDARCVEFYAADRDLCAALDREDAAAIAPAQSRFDRALAAARALAVEIQGAARG